jgi:hypothetical protein
VPFLSVGRVQTTRVEPPGISETGKLGVRCACWESPRSGMTWEEAGIVRCEEVAATLPSGGGFQRRGTGTIALWSSGHSRLLRVTRHEDTVGAEW